MQPSVPAEGGRAEAVTQRQASQRQAAERQASQRQALQRQALQRQAAERQASQRQALQRQASQRQAAERPLPFPGSGAEAHVRCRRDPKVRKAGANAPSVAGGVQRSERRAPMLRPSPAEPEVPKGGRQCSVVAGGTRRSEDRQEAAPIREGLCGKVPLRKRPSSGVPLRKRPSPGAPLQERPPPGAPVREGSRGSARAGEFPRKRPGCAPKAPRVCPGSYCFDFGCAERWLSSSSAASSAR